MIPLIKRSISELLRMYEVGMTSGSSDSSSYTLSTISRIIFTISACRPKKLCS